MIVFIFDDYFLDPSGIETYPCMNCPQVRNLTFCMVTTPNLDRYYMMLYKMDKLPLNQRKNNNN